MKILVLAGGKSHERNVSLATGKAIAECLATLGHDIKMIDTVDGKELLPMKISSLIGSTAPEAEQLTTGESLAKKSDLLPTGLPSDFGSCDVVFIALHGGTGENGTLQALLDLAGVRYTGSGVLASALAMDKHKAKLLFSSVGIPIPQTIFFGNEAAAIEYCSGPDSKQFAYPIIIKPNEEGSTVGLTLAENHEMLIAGIHHAAECGERILVEEYIPGRELTVAILGGEAMPVVEIVPKSGLYDYKAKYTSGQTDYLSPAPIDANIESEIKELAQLAFEVLGCHGYVRVDFRLNPEGELYCLEVNTLPGMTANSLVPKAAKAAGITFEQLLTRIIELSLK